MKKKSKASVGKPPEVGHKSEKKDYSFYVKRLEELIDTFFGGNKSEFARQMGTYYRQVANYIERGTSPGPAVLKSIIEYGLSADWLFSETCTKPYADNEAGDKLRKKYAPDEKKPAGYELSPDKDVAEGMAADVIESGYGSSIEELNKLLELISRYGGVRRIETMLKELAALEKLTKK